MATSFKGWGNSWGNSWGPISADPNAMSGGAGISLTATATATAALFGEGTAGFSFGATGTLSAGAPPSGDMAGFANFTFSAIGILTDPNAYPDRRPKSTNTLKLRRIAEGRATALSAKASSRGHAAKATGAAPPPPLVLPGVATCVVTRAGTRSKSATASGYASTPALGAATTTHTTVAQATSGGASTCSSASARTIRNLATAEGSARAQLGSCTGTAMHGYARARGAKRLLDTEVAVIVQLVVDKHR
jgi:hypothetical protein